ncbi:MAG: XisI protein [Gemmataceae bacterium]|nr:XisI protein [Gemmataceae bacterium]
MDRLTQYRDTIRRELRAFADWAGRSEPHVRYEVVHDPAIDHFELLSFGWDGRRRLHSVVYHLDLIDGKVWVQYDGTDRPIATALVEAGIPREDIVLAEKPADVRQFTGFGVG